MSEESIGRAVEIKRRSRCNTEQEKKYIKITRRKRKRKMKEWEMKERLRAEEEIAEKDLLK